MKWTELLIHLHFEIFRPSLPTTRRNLVLPPHHHPRRIKRHELRPRLPLEGQSSTCFRARGMGFQLSASGRGNCPIFPLPFTIIESFRTCHGNFRSSPATTRLLLGPVRREKCVPLEIDSVTAESGMIRRVQPPRSSSAESDRSPFQEMKLCARVPTIIVRRKGRVDR